MQLWLQDSDCPLTYDASIRHYTISMPRSAAKENEVWPCYKVNYCPYCGTHLPNDLVEKWMNVLEKEYKIDDPYDDEQKKLIPQEFKTDLWWKRRGF